MFIKTVSNEFVNSSHITALAVSSSKSDDYEFFFVYAASLRSSIYRLSEHEDEPSALSALESLAVFLNTNDPKNQSKDS